MFDIRKEIPELAFITNDDILLETTKNIIKKNIKKYYDPDICVDEIIKIYHDNKDISQIKQIITTMQEYGIEINNMKKLKTPELKFLHDLFIEISDDRDDITQFELNVKQNFTDKPEKIEKEKIINVNNIPDKYATVEKNNFDKFFDVAMNSEVEKINNIRDDIKLTVHEGFSHTQEKLGKIEQTIDKIEKLFDKPKKKGNIAENMIFSDLSYVFSNVKDVSGIPHSGDFWVEDKVLIDIKNYTSTVPTTEVVKIKDDICKNDNIYCGILISINSDISKHHIFDIEKIKDNKYLIYAPQPENIIILVRCALVVASIVSKEKIDNIKSTIELIKIEFNGLISEYANITKIVDSLIAFVDGYYERITSIDKYLKTLGE